MSGEGDSKRITHAPSSTFSTIDELLPSETLTWNPHAKITDQKLNSNCIGLKIGFRFKPAPFDTGFNLFEIVDNLRPKQYWLSYWQTFFMSPLAIGMICDVLLVVFTFTFRKLSPSFWTIRYSCVLAGEKAKQLWKTVRHVRSIEKKKRKKKKGNG